jgi:hypothetical protein
VADFDLFANRLLEEAKRFLEKAKESADSEAEAANLHAALILSFCALEAHINSIAEEFAAHADLSVHERAMLLERKRSTNAPVEGAKFVLKSKNAGRREDNGTSATDASGSPATGGGVCGRWHAAERVLPQSRFELEHAESPSKEAALEEKEEKQPDGWPVGRGGIGHQEVADRTRAELRAGRGVGGRTPDRSAARF